MDSVSIDKTLGTCSNLLDALLAVSSLGLKAGVIKINAEQVHGWVAFSQRKIIRAVISETAQTGGDALNVLVTLDGASCSYLPPEGEPAAPEATASRADNTAQKQNPAESAPSVAAVPPNVLPGDPCPKTDLRADDDDATLGEGAECVAFSPGIAGSATPESLPTWRRELAEEFEKLGDRQRSEFLSETGRLGDEGAPARRDIHLRRPQLFSVEQTDQVLAALAKTGFVSDFHDSAAQQTSAWTNFHGDPAKLPVAEIKARTRSSVLAKYILPSTIALLCIAIYVVPALLVQSTDKDTAADLRRQHMSKMIDASFDSLRESDAPSQRTVAFSMPPGQMPGSSSSQPSYDHRKTRDDGIHDDARAMIWKPSKHPLPVPAGADLEDAEKQLALGTEYMKHGKTFHAANLFIAALTKHPGHVELRLATIKAYMALRLYGQARVLCLVGMHGAANASDFGTLLQLFLTIPKA